ncbi:MAG: hypothetical protein ACE5EY_12230 [Anaerolineae bacterium]
MKKEMQQQQTAVFLLRITLGVIILATWYKNLNDGLYTANGLIGFFNWLFDPQNGNGSTLAWYNAFLQTAVVPIAGPFAVFQMIGEFLLGLALLFGAFTRLFGLIAMFFFANLFFSYFGGHEWIWTYVLLFMSALTIFLTAAGRRLGVDQWLVQSRNDSKLSILW